MEQRLTVPAWDDMQGEIQTALTGVTQFTNRQIRTTGIVCPHLATNDIVSYRFQFKHAKKMQTAVGSMHFHVIPVASANGNIKFTYTWGWYNPNDGDVIPDTLPNTGDSGDILLATTDQYKMKLVSIIPSIPVPMAVEKPSSILMVKITRVAPTGSDWGASNEIALLYGDIHFQQDGFGSQTELVKS
jgi:hypothetical protein